VIGPWDHAGTRVPAAESGGLRFGQASLLDLRRLHEQWYRWTMRGGDKPEFLRKRVAYYTLGAEEWRYADTLEAVTARYEHYHLQSTGDATAVGASGTLAQERSRGSPDQLLHDPRDVSMAKLESEVDPESRVDQRMVLAGSARQFVYHTPEFFQALDVSGFCRLSIWLSIDQPDVDLRVAIYEISRAGDSIELTTACLRARYRTNLREPTLIETRDPLRYDFTDFTFVSRRIAVGSRLRLVIAPVNSIHWQKNYSSGGVVSEESALDARLVTLRLFHDDAHPSALQIPVGSTEVG
jgi:putative CocE/NonD family hydrolase